VLEFFLEFFLAEKTARNVTDCSQPAFAFAHLFFEFLFVFFLPECGLFFVLVLVLMLMLVLMFKLFFVFFFAEQAADHVPHGTEPALALQARFFFALVELFFQLQL
jgi:hypothetical protein